MEWNYTIESGLGNILYGPYSLAVGNENQEYAKYTLVQGYRNILTTGATGSAIIAASGITGNDPYTLYCQNIVIYGTATLDLSGITIDHKHNALSGLQGGNLLGTEYFHLTYNDYIKITGNTFLTGFTFGTNTQIIFNSGGTLQGSTALTFDYTNQNLIIENDNLQSNNIPGVSLINNTIANSAVTVQQSPSLYFKNHNYTSADHTYEWQIATNTSAMNFMNSIDSAAYVNVASLTSSGSLTVAGSGSGLTINKTGTVNSSSQGILYNASSTASTGTRVRYSPYSRYIGRGWTGSASATVSFQKEVRPISGATVTGNYVWSADLNNSGFTDLMTLTSAGNLIIDNENLQSNFSDGLSLINETATNSATTQQNSPSLRFRNHYFNSGVDKTLDWQLATLPGKLFGIRTSDNGGAYANPFIINSTGTAIFTGSITTSQSTLSTISIDGFLAAPSNAATLTIPVRISPRLRLAGTAWNTTLTASTTQSFIQEVLPVSGATTSASLKWSYDNNGGGYTELMRITSDGTVMINTTTQVSTGSKLNIHGILSFTDYTSDYIQWNNGSKFYYNKIYSGAVDYTWQSYNGSVVTNNMFMKASNGYIGINNIVPTSTLHISGSTAYAIKLVTTGYTLTSDDSFVVCSASTVQSIYLPSGSTCVGRVYYIKAVGANHIIYPNGSDRIDYQTSQTLYELNTMQIVSNGSNWYIV